MIDSTSLAAALREWEHLLGSENVSYDLARCRQAETATFPTASRVWALLRPGDVAEVREVVATANRYRVPLYPVSSGKNWGYGSRVPASDGVLVDLGRLNRILDFSEPLGYVTLEPGVTQRQLFDFLKGRNSHLWMDATGASPDCSVVGNTMERGFGHTPMGDHCSNVCGLQVVMGNGEVVETGFGRFLGATTTPLARWGVGPSLDGLFSQSRFGIVTRMTVWLMPAPEHFEAFFFMCREDDGLGPIVDALRPLRMNGTLRSVMHVGNDYKVLAATSQYPWAETGEVTPLGRDRMVGIRRRLGIGIWNGSGALYGTRRQVREAKRLLRQALKGNVDRLQFVDDRLLGVMRRFARPFRAVTGWDVRETLKVLEPVYGLLQGRPTDATLASCYWRKRMAPPSAMDPDRDGCGLLWSSPVVPNSGDHALRVSQLVGDLLLSHGFEPQMSISLATERTLVCVITISYDRHVAGEDERALACYAELNRRLLALGYPPYRWSVRSGEGVAAGTGFDRAIEAIGSALDPNGILAPRRYTPVARTPQLQDQDALAPAG